MTNNIAKRRTLEERLKFDNGLTHGPNIINLQRGDITRRAICDISPRGVVRVLVKPNPEAMYSSWYRVKGDDASIKGCGVIVWGARDPSIMAMFDGEAVATIGL